MFSGAGVSMSVIMSRKDRRGKRAELPSEIAKKLKSCSVLNCEDWRDLNEHTTYHCFPTGDKNQDRWEIWTHLLRKAREDDTWIPFRGSLVCSHHFRTDDFVNDPLSKRRKLIKNAIPSVFPTFTVDLNDPQYSTESGDGDAEGESYEEYYGENEYENMYNDEESNQFGESNQEELGGYYEYADNVEEDQSLSPVMQGLLHSENVQMAATSTSSSAKRGLPSHQHHNMQVPIPKSRKSASPKSSGSPGLSIAPQAGTSNVGGVSKGGKRKSWPGTNHKSTKHQQVASTLPFHSKLKQSRQSNENGSHDDETDSIPFPLYVNPDLEIEMVDPEEDLAIYKQRINDLEQQNTSLTTMYENALQTLKDKYERQILILKTRLQEQEKLLRNNSIISTNNGYVPTKKVRLM